MGINDFSEYSQNTTLFTFLRSIWHESISRPAHSCYLISNVSFGFLSSIKVSGSFPLLYNNFVKYVRGKCLSNAVKTNFTDRLIDLVFVATNNFRPVGKLQRKPKQPYSQFRQEH